MKNLDIYIKDLIEKADISDSLKTEYDSVIVELLTAFNNNPHNSNVVDFISRSNYFDLIGKSRRETVHSRIISELLAGRYFDISKKNTLLHFFDIVLIRAKEQKVTIPKEFREAVLTRSIDIGSLVDKQVEYPLSKYVKTYTGNKNSVIDSKDKLDIYLRYNLESRVKSHGRRCVEIFIENKVLSQEHNYQTQTYYDNCVNGKQAMQFFIYLSPVSPRELSHYEDIDNKLKPLCQDKKGNRVYIHICYQDILDKIIVPLLQDKRMNTRDRVLIEEYVNCLELPAMPDDDEKDIGPKELSIMAISNEEKQLLAKFMGNPENERLMEIAVNRKLRKNLYSYKTDSCLTFEQALENALSYHIQNNGELQSMKDFNKIIGTQNGGARFLIYAVKETDDKLFYIPTHLFEYNGKAFSSIVDALKVAVRDYISRFGKTPKTVIDDFKVIYSKAKYHQHVFKNTEDSIRDMGYSPTGFDGLFIRNEINQDKILKINEILGNGFSINPITPHCYHELLMSGDDSLWEYYDKHLFNRLKNTNFFYRSNTENRIDEINKVFSTRIEKYMLSKDEERLLDNFYNNNRNLILSVYRILIENEQNLERHDLLEKEYKELVKKS